jgi:hypothetical protein
VPHPAERLPSQTRTTDGVSTRTSASHSGAHEDDASCACACECECAPECSRTG